MRILKSVAGIVAVWLLMAAFPLAQQEPPARGAGRGAAAPTEGNSRFPSDLGPGP